MHVWKPEGLASTKPINRESGTHISLDFRSDELVYMINSGNFAPDSSSLHKNQKDYQNRDKNEETVAAIVTRDDNKHATGSESEYESEYESEDESEVGTDNEMISEDTKIKPIKTAQFEHIILALIQFGHHGDGSVLDADLNEGKYYNKYDEFGQVITAVVEDFETVMIKETAMIKKTAEIEEKCC